MADNTNANQSGEQPTPAAPLKNGKYDVVTHRIVVISLGLTVLATGLNITILEGMGREPGPALANLGSVAIGALAMTVASIMRPN